MKKLTTLLALVSLAFCTHAFSPDIEGIESAWVEDKYPAGSIKDLPQAEKALADIQKARDYSKRLAEYSDQRCSETFLVNRCRDNVRRAKIRAERRFIDVEVEAKKHVRKAEIAKEKARQDERNARHAKGPEDPFAKKTPKGAANPVPGTVERSKKRAADVAHRQEQMNARVAAEEENLKKAELAKKEHEARIAKREAALKEREQKRAQRKQAK